jgi:hypothetical protein
MTPPRPRRHSSSHPSTTRSPPRKRPRRTRPRPSSARTPRRLVPSPTNKRKSTAATMPKACDNRWDRPSSQSSSRRLHSGDALTAAVTSPRPPHPCQRRRSSRRTCATFTLPRSRRRRARPSLSTSRSPHWPPLVQPPTSGDTRSTVVASARTSCTPRRRRRRGRLTGAGSPPRRRHGQRPSADATHLAHLAARAGSPAHRHAADGAVPDDARPAARRRV